MYHDRARDPVSLRRMHANHLRQDVAAVQNVAPISERPPSRIKWLPHPEFRDRGRYRSSRSRSRQKPPCSWRSQRYRLTGQTKSRHAAVDGAFAPPQPYAPRSRETSIIGSILRYEQRSRTFADSDDVAGRADSATQIMIQSAACHRAIAARTTSIARSMAYQSTAITAGSYRSVRVSEAPHRQVLEDAVLILSRPYGPRRAPPARP